MQQRTPTWFLWLKLLRLPTVFTAVTNVLCGYLITHNLRVNDLLGQMDLWFLVLSGAGLYLGGMVLNDVCDADLDRIERPERPVPSGRVRRSHALVLAIFLLFFGVTAAAGVGFISLWVAISLAVAIIAYDVWLKSTVMGCFGMGLCRFLNLLLGASAVDGWSQLLQMPQLGFAAGLFVYVLGVTWFARHEASVSARPQLQTGIGLVIAGLLVDAVVIWRADFLPRPQMGALVALGLLSGNVLLRTRSAIHSGQPRLVQKTIGVLLLNIIFLDATIVFAATGSSQLASVIVAMVIPAVVLKRWIPLS